MNVYEFFTTEALEEALCNLEAEIAGLEEHALEIRSIYEERKPKTKPKAAYTVPLAIEIGKSVMPYHEENRQGYQEEKSC